MPQPWFRAARRIYGVAQIDVLEPRLFMSASHHGAPSHPKQLLDEYAAYATATPTAVQGVTSSLSSVPILHSDPSAHAKLYLDFTGATAATWGGGSGSTYHPGTVPAFSEDSDATTFSTQELSDIAQIWARVAEKYSMFNIDVTTQDPGSYTDGNSLRVVIGGTDSWLGAAAGGVCFVGSFNNYGTTSSSFSDLNTAWVFPNELNNDPRLIAEAAAHEAGHSFGLEHQSVFNINGSLNSEYNPGNSDTAPIMGDSYYANRGLWWVGPAYDGNTNNQFTQNDLYVIGDTTGQYQRDGLNAPGFGFKTDTYANTPQTASSMPSLTTSSGNLGVSSVIEKPTDSDYFLFTTSGGNVTFTLSEAAYGAMLSGKIVLTTQGGVVLAASTASDNGETLTMALAAGTYCVGVTGDGSGTANGDDVGSYTLLGNTNGASATTTNTTITPQAPAAPTNITAIANGKTVAVSWTDNSTIETGYLVERSSDDGHTWNAVATVAANATSYVDTSANYNGMYAYRVTAVGTAGNGVGGVASVTTGADPFAPPTNGSAAIVGKKVVVSWKDNSTSETGFVILRSTNNGASWTAVTTTKANTTTFSDNIKIAPGGSDAYEVFAVNGSTRSNAFASASITLAPSAPAVKAKVTGNAVALSWKDVGGETGYTVDRLGTAGWQTIDTLPAGSIGVIDSDLAAGMRYQYRIHAYNAGGDTTSNPITAMLPKMKPTAAAKVGKSRVAAEVIALRAA